MRAALERSLELLEPLPPGPEHVETYGRMSSLEALSGRSPELGLEWAEKAVSLGEELGLRRELVRAYQWRGLMRCELGDLAGIDDLEHGLAETIELRMSLAIPAYVNLADHVWRQRGPARGVGDPEEGDRHRRRGAEARRPGRWRSHAGCSTTSVAGTSSSRSPRAFAASRRRTAPPSQARWRRGMPHSFSSAVGRSKRAQLSPRHVLEGARKIEDPQVLGPALVASALVAEAQRRRGISPPQRRGVPIT